MTLLQPCAHNHGDFLIYFDGKETSYTYQDRRIPVDSKGVVYCSFHWYFQVGFVYGVTFTLIVR